MKKKNEEVVGGTPARYMPAQPIPAMTKDLARYFLGYDDVEGADLNQLTDEQRLEVSRLLQFMLDELVKLP